MLRHFALNLAAAAVVWTWGFLTGRVAADVLSVLRRELR